MAGQQHGGGQARGGNASRFERFGQMIDWRWSVGAGVVTWIAGFIFTYLPLWLLEVGDGFDSATHELAIWVYSEGIGVGLAENGPEFSSLTAESFGFLTSALYASGLETDAFSVGVVYHMFLPALLLIIAGYLLTGHHINQGRTNDAVESVAAGISMSVPVLVLFFLSVLIVGDPPGGSSNLGEVLFVAVLFPVVFTAIGSTIRSRGGLTSPWGLVGGFGTFFVGFVLWHFLENPMDDGLTVQSIAAKTGESTGLTGVESFRTLFEDGGLFEIFWYIGGFVGDHGTGFANATPVWVVAVLPLLVGAVLSYTYEVSDPVAGLGEGARLASGYFIAVLLIAVAVVLTEVQELESLDGDWPTQATTEVGALVGSAPRAILLAGIVYPFLFAAVGGAGGALVYKARHHGFGQTSQDSTPASQQSPQQGQPGYQQGQQSQQSPQQGQPGYQQGQQGQQSPQQGQPGYQQGQQSPQQGQPGYQQGQQGQQPPQEGQPGHQNDQPPQGQQAPHEGEPGRPGEPNEEYQQGGTEDEFQQGGTEDEFQQGGTEDEFQQSGTEDEFQQGGTEDEFQQGGTEDEFQQGGTEDEFQQGGTEDEFQQGGTDDEFQQGETEDESQHGQPDTEQADEAAAEGSDDVTTGEDTAAEDEESADELSPEEILGADEETADDEDTEEGGR